MSAPVSIRALRNSELNPSEAISSPYNFSLRSRNISISLSNIAKRDKRYFVCYRNHPSTVLFFCHRTCSGAERFYHRISSTRQGCIPPRCKFFCTCSLSSFQVSFFAHPKQRRKTQPLGQQPRFHPSSRSSLHMRFEQTKCRTKE